MVKKLGFEKKVKRQREVETNNIVFTPEQAKELVQVLNDTKELKSDYERLNDVLDDEIKLGYGIIKKHPFFGCFF